MPLPSASAGTPREMFQHPALWRGGDLAGVRHPGIATGFPLLDKELPGSGWPVGGLTEILPAHEGIGELRLLGPALATLAANSRKLAWIAPPYLPYAPALAAAGILLSQLLIVRASHQQDALWAAEQSLRSGACGGVLLWTDTQDQTILRRLQLAAEHGHALAFLFTSPGLHSRTSPAVLRLRLESSQGGLAVHIIKRRGMPLHRPVLIPAMTTAWRPSLSDGSSHALVSPSTAATPAGDFPPRHAHA